MLAVVVVTRTMLVEPLFLLAAIPDRLSSALAHTTDVCVARCSIGISFIIAERTVLLFQLISIIIICTNPMLVTKPTRVSFNSRSFTAVWRHFFFTSLIFVHGKQTDSVYTMYCAACKTHIPTLLSSLSLWPIVAGRNKKKWWDFFKIEIRIMRVLKSNLQISRIWGETNGNWENIYEYFILLFWMTQQWRNHKYNSSMVCHQPSPIFGALGCAIHCIQLRNTYRNA